MTRTYKGKCPLCDSTDITTHVYFRTCNSCGYSEKVEYSRPKAYNSK